MMADPRVQTVTLDVCDLCLSGAGGECHTPGCSFWLNRAPDLPLTPVLDPAGVVHVDTRDEAIMERLRDASMAWVHGDAEDMVRAVLAALRGEQ